MDAGKVCGYGLTVRRCLVDRKVALLSNVNMNFVVRMLKGELSVYGQEGYGNELGVLLNKGSSYYEFEPEMTFLVLDLMEICGHELGNARERFRDWFAAAEGGFDSGQVYYVSDGFLWGCEVEVMHDPAQKQAVEQMWMEELWEFCGRHSNVFVLPYHRMVEDLGAENFYSMKMWYMGRVLLTNEAQKRLAELILSKVRLHGRTARKVLLLDLDNTLWGGLAGETDHTPVVLSSEHSGLCYKNLQRVVKQMQSEGVLLGIVSKNNEKDALDIISGHPHMILGPECFAAVKINWRAKHENIQEIAGELNLGLDSFVFFDDSSAERELVRKMLPQVAVPDFPERPEELAPCMVKIYREYFEKTRLTREDMEKTRQYADNVKRNQLQEASVDFGSYLKSLRMKVTRVDGKENGDRLLQLLNKTNQFNLTTRRFDQAGLAALLEEPDAKAFLYKVEDCFGDNGIVAAVIIRIAGVTARIEDMVMSCRVMGRNVEYAILDDIEKDLLGRGVTRLAGTFCPSGRNQPVEMLFEGLGYDVIKAGEDGSKEYELLLEQRPERLYYAEVC